MVTADLVLFMRKSILRKKSGTSHQEVSVSCTTQECDDFTSSCPISVLYYLTSGRLGKVKGEENFIPLG